jgi:hypothetical protein
MKGSAWFRSKGLAQAIALDVRFGLRSLRNNPGFTIAAIVTLALGIGSTTAVFGVVNGVLLRPLPFHEPDRLVIVQSLRIVLPGVFAGVLAAFALSRFLQSLLYEVATTDPGVFGLLPAALAVVALAAAVIPAVRALRLDPVTSLRAE